MKRFVSFLFIGLLLIGFLAEGWYLGRVQSELKETQMELATAQNSIADLMNQVVLQENELLSMKAQLEEAELKYFSSLEELEAWLARDNTSENQYAPGNFECRDFALMLQEHAQADGFILSTEVLPVGAHWVNVATIGDKDYYIEPQNKQIILEKN